MKLTSENILDQLQNIDNWTLNNDTIRKDYTFKNFIEAMEFINKAAIIAEDLNHHPEWSNVYNKVSISLTTHDVGGISEKDFQLAKAIDALSI